MHFTIAFDLPTRYGYDSDHPLAEGKVGKMGIAIDTVGDMQALLEDVSLEEITLIMNTGAAGFILLAFYTVVAGQRGADLKKLSGTVLHGNYIYPPTASLRIIDDVIEWCRQELPGWKIITAPVHGIDNPVPQNDESVREAQIQKISDWKRNRNPARVDSVLQGLNDRAASGENILSAVMEAAENHCTLGEIADTLREVFGELGGGCWNST